MDIKEIYLLTAFVCAACDGEIAPEEVSLIKEMCNNNDMFGDLDVETKLNEYVAATNKYGIRFINDFLRILESSELTTQEQLTIVRIAIGIIEADGQVLYSEVKFFKRLRPCLNVSDDEILKVLPDKEDYLLSDIRTTEYSFDDNIQFSEIKWNNPV